MASPPTQQPHRLYRLVLTPPVGASNTVPVETLDLTWPDVLARLGPQKPSVTKETPFMFGAHVMPLGCATQNQFISALSFVTNDLDGDKADQPSFHFTLQQAVDVGLVLKGMGVGFVLYTTHSNTAVQPEHLCRVRFLIPLSRDVQKHEYERIWDWLNEKIFSGKVDPGTRKPSQRYWMPAFPPRGAAPLWIPVDGAPLDVEGVLSAAPPASSSSSRATLPQTPTREDLKKLGNSLVRSLDPKRVAVGEAMRALYRREAYAGTGAREPTTWALCQEIARKYPRMDAAQTAELFIPSLSLMGEGSPTLNQVITKLTSASNHQREHEAKGKGSMIAKAFGDPSRTEPYSPEELACFQELCGATSTSEILWIVQRSPEWFILGPRGYEHFGSEKDAKVAAKTLLAPASTAGLELTRFTQQGARDTPLEDLVTLHGTIASKPPVYDLRVAGTVFDRVEKRMVVACGALRVAGPRHDEQIQRWLQLLGGERYPLLEQWLAALPLLARPLVLLYLDGPMSAGKSWLAECLSRLWTDDGFTTFEEATGNWTERVRECPLCVADEALPADFRGKPKAAELRRFIQQQFMRLTQKHKVGASLRGSPRAMILANSEKLLDSGATLNESELAATVGRLLYIKIPGTATESPAGRYLAELGRQTTARWRDEDLLARHVLSLAETVKLDLENRFLLPGGDAQLMNAMATRSGVAALLCECLVRYLGDTRKLETVRGGAVQLRRREGEHLFASHEFFRDALDVYLPNDPRPSTAEIKEGFATICDGRDHDIRRRVEGKQIRFKRVNFVRLLKRAEDLELGDEAELRRAVKAVPDAATADTSAADAGLS